MGNKRYTFYFNGRICCPGSIFMRLCSLARRLITHYADRFYEKNIYP